MRFSLGFFLASLLLFSGDLRASLEIEKKAPDTFQKAVFAAGCFWCIVPPFDKTKGVINTQVGYTGGTKENATYPRVSSGKTKHIEAIQVTFDPSVVSFEELLDIFWVNVDPFDGKGQFCDKGRQYISAIFFHNPDQKKAAQTSVNKVLKKLNLKKPELIQTQIQSFSTFFPAEAKHQDYYKRHPFKYKFYRSRCGRDARLKDIWTPKARSK